MHEDLLARVQRPDKGADDVRLAQRQVHDDMLYQSARVCDPNFEVLGESDLQLLFELYDSHFFQGAIFRSLKQSDLPLRFRVSKRMTSAGGKTTMYFPRQRGAGRQPISFEIAISSVLLFGSFAADQQSQVVGVPCHSRLEGLQRIFEHELLHLIELLLWRDSSCSRQRFRRLAQNHFGHRESHHQLTTPREIAAAKYRVRVGCPVQFDHEGQELRGFVNRITRRATVLVPHKRGERYSDGQRYLKFYVPLDSLQPLS